MTAEYEVYSRPPCARSKSTIHDIRNRMLWNDLMTEEKAIDIYLESQEDPYMRKKIASCCQGNPKLQYITEQYLERMAKIKLFL